MDRKRQPLTAPKKNAGGHQSICNKCRFAKDNHFCIANANKHSIFVRSIRLTAVSNRSAGSSKPLALIGRTDSRQTKNWNEIFFTYSIRTDNSNFVQTGGKSNHLFDL